MSFTADIYKEICTDIAKNSRPNSVYAMRMLKLSNGINIAFSINTLTYMRGAFFSVDAKATANQFPRWKGVDIVIAKLPAYGTDQEYVNVMQEVQLIFSKLSLRTCEANWRNAPLQKTPLQLLLRF